MKKCHFLTKIRWNSSLFVIIRIHSLWFKHIRAYSALQKHISFINLKTNWYLMVVCPKIKIFNFWPLGGAKPKFFYCILLNAWNCIGTWSFIKKYKPEVLFLFLVEILRQSWLWYNKTKFQTCVMISPFF